MTPDEAFVAIESLHPGVGIAKVAVTRRYDSALHHECDVGYSDDGGHLHLWTGATFEEAIAKMKANLATLGGKG